MGIYAYIFTYALNKNSIFLKLNFVYLKYSINRKFKEINKNNELICH